MESMLPAHDVPTTTSKFQRVFDSITLEIYGHLSTNVFDTMTMTDADLTFKLM